MKVDVKGLIEKLLTKQKIDTLLTVNTGLAQTVYTLNGNINDYDFIQLVAFTGYNNRFGMTLPTSVFTSSTAQNYYASLGTEFNIYNLSVSYRSSTQIAVVSKGSGTNGMTVIGIKL